MIKYIVLGDGHVFLSMILENLYSLHDVNFSIDIVKNQKTESDVPYKLDSINTNEYHHSKYQFNDNSNKYIVGAGQVYSKLKIYDFFSKNYGITANNYYNLIAKNTSIAQTVDLGNGIHINPGTVIAPYAQIGNLVTINRNVSIGHHTTISDFTNINPGVNIAGFCKIGKNVTIGMGANIIDGITIGDNTVIGAGSIVTKNIPENVVAYGCPAKIIRSNNIY